MRGELVGKSAEPVAESAIVWFEGFGPDSEYFRSAFDAGAFIGREGRSAEWVLDDEPRAWPAAVERDPAPGERERPMSGRRLGIDVARSCLVVETGLDGGERIVVNLAAANAVIELGRRSIGQ